MPQTCSSKTSISRVERLPRSIACVSRKTCVGPSPLIVQESEELPFSIELRGGAKFGQHLARDAVDAHTGPLRALAITRIGDLPQKSDHAQLLQ